MHKNMHKGTHARTHARSLSSPSPSPPSLSLSLSLYIYIYIHIYIYIYINVCVRACVCVYICARDSTVSCVTIKFYYPTCLARCHEFGLEHMHAWSAFPIVVCYVNVVEAPLHANRCGQPSSVQIWTTSFWRRTKYSINSSRESLPVVV